MNEATIVRKLITSLKVLRVAVIDKHADRVVRNVPDVSIDYMGLTSWLEVKYLREGETESARRKHFTESQLVRCEQRDQQAYCRYFIAYHANHVLCAALLRPVDVRWALDQDSLDILSHASLFGPFNVAVARLALALKERSDVRNLRVDEDEKEADRASQGKATVALRRGRYLVAGKVSSHGLAGPGTRRRAAMSVAKQSRRRRKRR